MINQVLKFLYLKNIRLMNAYITYTFNEPITGHPLAITHKAVHHHHIQYISICRWERTSRSATSGPGLSFIFVFVSYDLNHKHSRLLFKTKTAFPVLVGLSLPEIRKKLLLLFVSRSYIPQRITERQNLSRWTPIHFKLWNYADKSLALPGSK